MNKVLEPWLLFYRQYPLIKSLLIHAVGSKYRGSWIGLLWPILMPVLLIGVFSFVFGYVMPLKWVSTKPVDISFPLFLFSGLVVFTLFSDVVNKAPSIVLENVNLVKKVVFPLEVLCVSNALVAVFFFIINLFVFLGFVLIAGVGVSVHDLLYVLFLIPFTLFLIGVSWFLSALSVYVKDSIHIVGVLVSAAMFLSPVFYPVSSAPDLVKNTMLLNPLAILIEALRGFVFYDEAPSLASWIVIWFGGFFSFYVGFFWFKKVKEGFADVI